MINSSFPNWLKIHLGFFFFLGFYANVLLICGLLGLFSPTLIVGLFIVTLFALIFWLKKSCSLKLSIPKDLSPLEWVFIVSIAGMVLLTLAQGCLPPYARDALIHHLALPKLYLNHQKIWDMSFAEQAYNPMLIDILYGLPLALKLDQMANWLHFIFSLGSAHLLFIFCKQFINRPAALFACLFFLSIPQVIQSGSQAYVDLGISYYALLSLVCLYFWGQTTQKNGFLICAGIASGFAMASKYNGFLLVFVFSMVLILFCSRKSFSSKQILGFLFLFWLGAFISDWPWLLRNMLWTGNPIYPFFGSWLGFKGLSEDAIMRVPPLIHRYAIYHESLIEILMLPVRIFLFGQEGAPNLFDGRLSPALLIFLPWVFRKSDKIPRGTLQALIFICVFYGFYMLVFRIMRMRYLLPVVPLLTFLMMVGWQNLKGPVARRLGVCLLGLFLGLNGWWVTKRLSHLGVLSYLTGSVSRTQFLESRLGEYPLEQFANHHLKPNHKILFVFLGHRGYYSAIPYTYDFHDPGRSWRRWLKRARTPEELQGLIRAEGISHLMIHRKFFEAGFGSANVFLLDDSGRRVLAEYIEKHLTLLAERGSFQLLQI